MLLRPIFGLKEHAYIILPTIEKPFEASFLNQLVFAPFLLPFSDKEIIELDINLDQYEQLFLNPDGEKNLISINTLCLFELN
ncbi:MAG: hypothetical protein ACREHC_06120 [Candidatus Levyibacteriota bacterium]